MYIIGLTGGIGSGKSAASQRFQEHQVTVVDADKVAREVVEPNSPVLNKITEKHGLDILLEDGLLNRAALRKIIFDNPDERKWLENLTHPAIRDIIAQRLLAPQSNNEANYRILESPLLLETTQRDFVQRICLIDVEEETQIQRVMQRDNNDKAQVKAIIAAQMPRTEKCKKADDIVNNNSSLNQLYQQIDELHLRYTQLAAQHAS